MIMKPLLKGKERESLRGNIYSHSQKEEEVELIRKE